MEGRIVASKFLFLICQLIQLVNECVVFIEEAVGLLLETHVAVELLLLHRPQLLELLILSLDQLVQSADLLCHCSQVLLILGNRLPCLSISL